MELLIKIAFYALLCFGYFCIYIVNYGIMISNFAGMLIEIIVWTGLCILGMWILEYVWRLLEEDDDG